jgi:thiamine biosynthesis lipoprotein
VTISAVEPVGRREFLQITAIAGALLVGGAVWRLGLKPEPVVVKETRSLMGTVINLTVVTDDPQSGQAALEAIFGEMRRLVNIFDHRRNDSDLTRLNRTGHLQSPPAELVLVLDQAKEFGDLTDGAFDVSVKPLLSAIQNGTLDWGEAQALVDYRRIAVATDAVRLEPGMALTLDGIAKGYVVDAAVEDLHEHGYENVLVEAGGDLVGNGRSADGTPWRVGVILPRASQLPQLLATLSVTSQAVATSGDYMNSFTADFSRHHIIDPRTGSSPPESASVTVLAPNAAMADALSTGLMVMGPEEGLALVNRLPGVEALFVSKELQTRQSAGFPSPD